MNWCTAGLLCNCSGATLVSHWKWLGSLIGSKSRNNCGGWSKVASSTNMDQSISSQVWAAFWQRLAIFLSMCERNNQGVHGTIQLSKKANWWYSKRKMSATNATFLYSIRLPEFPTFHVLLPELLRKFNNLVCRIELPIATRFRHQLLIASHSLFNKKLVCHRFLMCMTATPTPYRQPLTWLIQPQHRWCCDDDDIVWRLLFVLEWRQLPLTCLC